MIPKSVLRFSEKIMLDERDASDKSGSTQLNPTLARRGRDRPELPDALLGVGDD